MSLKYLINIKITFITILLFSLTACGESGGASTEESTDKKDFTINVSSIVVKRISNDDLIDIDISDTESPLLTLSD